MRNLKHTTICRQAALLWEKDKDYVTVNRPVLPPLTPPTRGGEQDPPPLVGGVRGGGQNQHKIIYSNKTFNLKENLEYMTPVSSQLLR